ncbi:7232_t:CDS:2, partial [Paraglomus brasilianum]
MTSQEQSATARSRDYQTLVAKRLKDAGILAREIRPGNVQELLHHHYYVSVAVVAIKISLQKTSQDEFTVDEDKENRNDMLDVTNDIDDVYEEDTNTDRMLEKICMLLEQELTSFPYCIGSGEKAADIEIFGTGVKLVVAKVYDIILFLVFNSFISINTYLVECGMFMGNTYSLTSGDVVVWIDGQEVAPGHRMTIRP